MKRQRCGDVCAQSECTAFMEPLKKSNPPFKVEGLRAKIIIGKILEKQMSFAAAEYERTKITTRRVKFHF
jgi:hypothetical protein